MALAVVTMAYDDTEYLPIWVKYWSQHVDRQHMYVIIHGGNPTLMEMATGCTVIPMNRPAPYRQMEADRWHMLSDFVGSLTYMYDTVLYNDVDEILALDPKVDAPLAEYLTTIDAPVTAPVGVEIIHRPDHEPDDLDINQPILGQRRFYRGVSRFGKPCIIKKPTRWRRGGHFAFSDTISFDENLYNFHLRFFDQRLFLSKAERRRQTTLAPRGKNTTPARRWRASSEGAVELLQQLNVLPVDVNRPWGFSGMMRQVRRRSAVVDTAEGSFTRIPGVGDTVLRRLPDHIASLF